jgi:hypothetical protein
MLSGEFVEEAEVQAEKLFVKSGKAAGCTAHILAPWHNQRPRIVIACSRFGSVVTVHLLHTLFAVTVIKLGGKALPKDLLLLRVTENRVLYVTSAHKLLLV